MIRIGPVVPATTLAALTVFAAPASAHTGVGTASGLGAGLAHPFGGPDHLLAMLAVGLMVGFRAGPALWAWPASFVGVMLFGALLGSNGVPIPAVETAILLSFVALGLLLGLRARLPLGLGACVTGLFALFHGHAHGAEIVPGASGFAYAAGFALATAGLHVTGIGLARLAARAPRPAAAMERVSGAAIAATGIVLAALG